METQFNGVYAMSDVTGIPLALGKPLPKAGTLAHSQAEVVVQNIAHKMVGKGKTASFDDGGECFIEIGDGKAGFGSDNFYGEPMPDVKFHPAARRWHTSKVPFEKDCLRRWF